MRSFSKEYLVGAGETDCFNYCRPSAFLNFMQDTATLHAGMIGLSRDTLVKNFGAIWILARCWFRLSEPIHAFETVQVETWHRGLRGVMSVSYTHLDVYKRQYSNIAALPIN